ncbi:sensor histidine kinase [Rubrivirga sp.]|uniref:sensor histidine kinase n=1 Tax=Rubrivirga sp. TaxID=1885344 RepID=UPI003B51F59B
MPTSPAPDPRPTPTAQDGPSDPEGVEGLVVEVVDETPDPLRVLLIEDDPDHAALVEAYLADVRDPAVRLDHVTMVEAATTALEGAQGDPFHAVLADQQLPDSQYWETVARVVAAAGGVPVVALTSLGDLEVALDAVRAGASDYLVKAELTPEVLRRTLRYAVERARRDRALRETNEALRQTLRHVRQMQAQIVEQEKLAGLGRLLAGVAHELRNPLGLAVGFAEAAAAEAHALAEAADLTGEAAAHLDALRQAADGAARQGRRADAVVRSMYEHARGVDGVLRPVALGDVVRAAVAQAVPGDVEVSVDVAPGVEVVGVGSALTRMLSNLIGNAVLAARQGGGRVAVTVEADDGEAVLTVADDGPGIDPATLATAFEPFTSGWASGRRVGLGLSLARAIAVGHGGRIELGPSDLGGAAARVTLPRDAAGG